MAPTIAKPLLSDLVAQTGQVPLSHVRPVGDRPDLASVDNESGAGIPLIDLGKLDGPVRRTVVEAIGRACESDGFFMVRAMLPAADVGSGDQPNFLGSACLSSLQTDTG